MNNIVYHYTSPQGALNILGNNTLWFTDCQYLNDKHELFYANESVKKAFKKIAKERSVWDGGFFNNKFSKRLQKLSYEDIDIEWLFESCEESYKLKKTPSYSYYVLCASNNSDCISMWKYYAKNGAYQGYSIGLNANNIKTFISKWANSTNGMVKIVSNEIFYAPPKEVERIFYENIKKLIMNFDEKMEQLPEDCDFSPLMNNFKEELSDYMNEKKLFFKDPVFESEKEYSFVLKVNNDFFDENRYERNSNESKTSIKGNFRVGDSGIITPYVECTFSLAEREKVFTKITLAPMIEKEIAAKSFRRFLGSAAIDIVPSSVNMRF